MLKFLFLLFIISPLLVLSSAPKESYCFDQMIEVNKQWYKFKKECPNEKVIFDTDEDAIKAHLLLVCNSLSKNTPENIKNYQLKKRESLIEELREYAHRKTFPTNLYHKIRTPYFVDDFGVHCAVGYLMKQSGNEELVETIRKNENYKYIEDIRTPGVQNWADEFGFTVEELKWIQPAYLPHPEKISQIKEGTNGSVSNMDVGFSGEIIIAGEFDRIGQVPCLNIGVYHQNQLSCLGQGVKGEINCVDRNSNGIYVFGRLEYEGDDYSMAYFKDGAWEYDNIPSRDGATITASIVSGSKKYIALKHLTKPNVQEIWVKTSGSWEKEIELEGVVKTADFSSFGRCFAGKFEKAIVFEDNIPEDTIYTNNVIFRDNQNETWSGLDGAGISDTVETLLNISGQIYFGGKATNEENSSGVLLTRYLNNSLQPLLLSSMFPNSDTPSINSIVRGKLNGSLIIGGEFRYDPFIGTGGSNLASYNVFSHSLSMIAMLDSTVNTITERNGDVFFGGDFQKNLSFEEINHIGKVESLMNTKENNNQVSINVYPNPFVNHITVDGINEESKYQVVDSKGKVLTKGKLEIHDNKITLDKIPSGIYFLKMKTNGHEISKRIVKQ